MTCYDKLLWLNYAQLKLPKIILCWTNFVIRYRANHAWVLSSGFTERRNRKGGGVRKYSVAYLSDKDVARLLKAAAETALGELEARWGQQYPMVIQLWCRKWENLSAYFRYAPISGRSSTRPTSSGLFTGSSAN